MNIERPSSQIALLAKASTPVVESAPAKSDVSPGVRVLWFAAILCQPYYVFANGQPQISDFILLALSVPALVRLRHAAPNLKRTLTPLVVFTIVVITVNLFYFSLLADRLFVNSAMFYVFNLVLFAGSAIRLTESPSLFRTTAVAYWLALLSQAVLAFAYGRIRHGRMVLSFNNPNQLAYFVLCSALIVVVLHEIRRLPWFILLSGFAAAIIVMLKTYSRAGAIALVIVLALSLARRPGMLIVFFVGAMIAIEVFNVDPTQDHEWTQRVQSVEGATANDYLADRAMNRLVEYPEYLLLGAGEGGFTRFGEIVELHSSYASVAFAYGIPGVLCLFIFFVSLVKPLPRRLSTLLIPMAVYACFHNGMRARALWILFAVIIAAGARYESGEIKEDG